jgi:hypothetical protein
MKYPGTEHQGRFYAQYSPEHGCALRASMVVRSADREFSNYVFFGSKQECLDWLNDKSHIEELIEIYNHLMEKEPASLEICTLLDKPSRRNPAVTLKPKYVGFQVPNAFVVGYGLDYNEYYRNMPYIGVLRPEVYEK